MQLTLTLDPRNQQEVAAAIALLLREAGAPVMRQAPDNTAAPQTAPAPVTTSAQTMATTTAVGTGAITTTADNPRDEQLKVLIDSVGKQLTKTASLKDGQRGSVGDEVVNEVGTPFVIAATFRGTIIVEDEAGMLMAADSTGFRLAPSEDDQPIAQQAAANTARATQEIEDADVLGEAPPPPPVEVSYEQLHAVATQAVGKIGGIRVRQLIGTVQDGAVQLSQLEPANYGKAYAALNAEMSNAA